MFAPSKSIYDVFQIHNNQKIFLRSVHCENPHQARAMTWDLCMTEIKKVNPYAKVDHLLAEIRTEGYHTK